MSSEADPASYEIAYEQAMRALDNQSAILESYRGRAATIISAATIATSFLGSQAFGPKHSTTGWTWFAVGCFLGVLASAGLVLRPRSGWEFSAVGEKIIDDSIENPRGRTLTAPEIRRDLAIHMTRSYNQNRGRLQFVEWALQASLIFLAVEIVA